MWDEPFVFRGQRIPVAQFWFSGSPGLGSLRAWFGGGGIRGVEPNPDFW